MSCLTDPHTLPTLQLILILVSPLVDVLPDADVVESGGVQLDMKSNLFTVCGHGVIVSGYVGLALVLSGRGGVRGYRTIGLKCRLNSAVIESMLELRVVSGRLIA